MKIKDWILNNRGLVILGAIVIFAIIALASKSGGGDSLATCIKVSGAKFYGSKNCPKCNAQKKLFESDAGRLPYIECLGPDGMQNTVCNEANVTKYPTWIFPDGNRVEGQVLSLDYFSQKTKCHS